MYDPNYEEIILEFDASISGINVTIRYEQGVDPEDYSDVLDPKTGKTSAEFIALWYRSSEEEREAIREDIQIGRAHV